MERRERTNQSETYRAMFREEADSILNRINNLRSVIMESHNKGFVREVHRKLEKNR